MNRATFVLVMLLLLPLGGGCQVRSVPTVEASTNTVASDRTEGFTIAGRVLQPEIAKDPPTRARGLQHRTPPEDGLILVFPYKAKHSIWMLNCPEDLEAWVISDEGTVLEVLDLPAEPKRSQQESTWRYHARLPRHRSRHEARIVWEFGAGTSRRLGVEPGDVISGSWPTVLGTDN